MYSQAQGKATMKWKKNNIKRVEINLNRENDKDIIEYFDSIDNVQGEVKRLVRARIQKNIFTNRQINLMRTTINVRINQLEDWIEEAQEVIASCQEGIEKTPLDPVKERLTIRFNKYTKDIRMWSDEIEQLKDLRKYIEGAYYGQE